MWTALLWIGLGFPCFPSADQAPASSVAGTAMRPRLAIMSPDPGEFPLRLEHHWGGLGANRVYFDDHDGPFEAVVERSAEGVRVTFNGWEERPFTASSKTIRVAYRGPGAGSADFIAEALPDGEVQLRVAGRPSIRGEEISVRLGVPEVKYVSSKPKKRSGDRTR
jgi:hypothetical protein